jgi:hypothetical protein
MTQRVPRGTTAMLRHTIATAAELRKRGMPGPDIYASFMSHWKADHEVCQRCNCPGCETATATGQRIILSVLAAIRENEP